MTKLNPLHTLIGHWTGTKQVLLPGEPAHESVSTGAITSLIGGRFIQLSYTWAFDGVVQDGVLLLGPPQPNNTLSAVWLDSWHMDNKVMICEGQLNDHGYVDVRGTYSVEASPDWGWRIMLEPDLEIFRIVMYNVSPDGDETRGVEATYTRVP